MRKTGVKEYSNEGYPVQIIVEKRLKDGALRKVRLSIY